METEHSKNIIYLPNPENWKKFLSVRSFFTDYLQRGGLESFEIRDEEEDEEEFYTLYPDASMGQPGDEPGEDAHRQSVFEELGISRDTIQSAMDELAKWARRTGSISGVKVPPETLDGVFTVELDCVDFYGEYLKGWIDVLGKLSTLSFRNSGRDTVLIDVCVKNVWEAVEAHE